MNNLKITILTFLQNLPESPYDQFNKAFELYRELPNKVKALELQYNRIGFKEQSLKNLLYDLQKLAGITDVEILEVSTVEAPVYQLSPNNQTSEAVRNFANAFGKCADQEYDAVLVLLKFIELFGEENLLTTPELQEYFKIPLEYLENIAEEFKDNELSSFSDEVSEYIKNIIVGIEFPEELENILLLNKNVLPLIPYDDNKNQNQDDFINELSIKAAAVIENVTGEKTEPILTEDFKAIRDEFAFLNDPNCPELLFVVVGKRISAWKIYQALHAQLQEINAGKQEATAEQTLDITLKCERAFNENQQLWDELNHFNTTGEIFGKHPIFRQSVAKREVDGMTNEELFKFKNAAATFLSRKRKDLPKNIGKPEKLEQLNKEIADKEYMLSLVNAKIGVANAGTQKK